MKNKKYIGLIIVLFISIGFAILTSNLNIGGTASFSDASFNVHFENAKVEKSAVDNATITINEDKVSINSSGTFEKPGDYIDTSFYVMNTGTMDARLDTLTVSGISTELSNYFAYTLKYDWNKANVNRSDVLRAGQGRKVNLHIEYKYDVEQLTTATNLSLRVTMTYINPKNAITDTVWNYEYTGGEQAFYVNKSGNYKLEAWGAQGGSGYNPVSNKSNGLGGYGGYSTGLVQLDKNQTIYLNIGGKGTDCSNDVLSTQVLGGYNGGGKGDRNPNSGWGAGGGATHIALEKGLLSTFSDKIDRLLIVSGAGGGGGVFSYTSEYVNNGGSGGGKVGVAGQHNYSSMIGGGGGTQISGGLGFDDQPAGSFGLGGYNYGSGGGAGLYGGGAGYSCGSSAGGGSGYIGNPNLTDKAMYCYNCDESADASTKTISTTNVSETPKSQYAKIGNGFIRITYLGK